MTTALLALIGLALIVIAIALFGIWMDTPSRKFTMLHMMRIAAALEALAQQGQTAGQQPAQSPWAAFLQQATEAARAAEATRAARAQPAEVSGLEKQ